MFKRNDMKPLIWGLICGLSFYIIKGIIKANTIINK